MTSNPMLRQTIQILLDNTTLDSCDLRLYKSPITLSGSMVPGDFDEADYTGYAAASVGPAGTPYDDAAGNAVLSFAGAHFQPSAATVGNTIYGYYLTASVSGVSVVVEAVEFDEPIPMMGPTDALDVTPAWKIGLAAAG